MATAQIKLFQTQMTNHYVRLFFWKIISAQEENWHGAEILSNFPDLESLQDASLKLLPEPLKN